MSLSSGPKQCPTHALLYATIGRIAKKSARVHWPARKPWRNLRARRKRTPPSKDRSKPRWRRRSVPAREPSYGQGYGSPPRRSSDPRGRIRRGDGDLGAKAPIPALWSIPPPVQRARVPGQVEIVLKRLDQSVARMRVIRTFKVRCAAFGAEMQERIGLA